MQGWGKKGQAETHCGWKEILHCCGYRSLSLGLIAGHCLPGKWWFTLLDPDGEIKPDFNSSCVKSVWVCQKCFPCRGPTILWFANFLTVRELLGLGMAAGMGANHCLSQGVTTHLSLPWARPAGHTVEAVKKEKGKGGLTELRNEQRKYKFAQTLSSEYCCMGGLSAEAALKDQGGVWVLREAIAQPKEVAQLLPVASTSSAAEFSTPSSYSGLSSKSCSCGKDLVEKRTYFLNSSAENLQEASPSAQVHNHIKMKFYRRGHLLLLLWCKCEVQK